MLGLGLLGLQLRELGSRVPGVLESRAPKLKESWVLGVLEPWALVSWADMICYLGICEGISFDFFGNLS